MGSICSVLLFVIMGAYAYQKSDVWMHKKDVDIMTSTQRNFFTSDDEFNFSNGLNFAIGFTAYDNETEDILDSSYGKLIFAKFAWG